MTNAAAHLDAHATGPQRDDAQALVALMQRVTNEPPVMWGSGIVGFGRYRYRYDSGREGEAALVSFAVRKGEFAIYLLADMAERDRLLATLGRHRAAKACVYVKRLADVDLAVLEALIAMSVQETLRRHPPAA